MTFIEMQENNGRFYIRLVFEDGIYRVQAYPIFKDEVLSRTIREYTYTQDEKKKAIATFKRYAKKYR